MDKKMKKGALSELVAAVRKGVEEKGLLSSFEMEAEEAKKRVGEEYVAKKLADLCIEESVPKPCPICGQNARVRKKFVPRSFKTLSGEHTIRRHQHYCKNCRETFYPRDTELGLPKVGEASLELERRITDMMLLCPAAEAAEHWNMHYPSCALSENQFRQSATRLGEMAEEADPHLLQAALAEPAQSPSAVVYFMSDGSMLLLREALQKFEESLGAGWREMKLGIAFRHENRVAGENVTRGVITNARYVGEFAQEKFKELLKAAVDIECSSGVKLVVYLADGAPENWAVADAVRPGALQILDWYHAVQNVMAYAKSILGETNPQALELWKAGAEILLRTGQINLLIRTLMDTIELCDDSTLEALDDIVRYLRNNEKRMDYPTYRKLGLLIGSGPIESAQRHVIQIRMKRSGQRWSDRGARRMARLRAASKTSGPERVYAAIRWAYRETLRNRQQLTQIAASRKAPKRYASNR